MHLPPNARALTWHRCSLPALQAVVAAMDDNSITIDANHPLAGKELTFDVREAGCGRARECLCLRGIARDPRQLQGMCGCGASGAASRIPALACSSVRCIHCLLAAVSLPSISQVEVTRIIPAARLQKATFGAGCFWCAPLPGCSCRCCVAAEGLGARAEDGFQ